MHTYNILIVQHVTELLYSEENFNIITRIMIHGMLLSLNWLLHLE